MDNLRLHFFILLLITCSCTSVRVEQETYPPEVVDRTRLTLLSQEKMQILDQPQISIESLRSELQKNGTISVFITSETKEVYSQALESWPTIETTLRKSKLFKNQKFVVQKQDSISIQSLHSLLDSAKNEKATLSLVLQCREHISVPTSLFHNALKSITLNLYDLFPVLKYNLGSFDANYTVLWEGSVVSPQSEQAFFHVTGMANVRSLDRGKDLLFDGEKDYQKIAYHKAGQFFARSLLSRIEIRAKSKEKPSGKI